MPDFFLDRLISVQWSLHEFSSRINEVADRNGGSIDGVTQADLSGGNAVNTASALVSLGAKVTPIICTNPLGLQRIEYHFRKKPLDFSHIKIHQRASITTALEFRTQNDKTNVMLRDLGALEDFGPKDLTDDDYQIFEHVDYVCLFNWAGTLKYGTELAETVFGSARRGKAKTYYDTADPTPNAQHMPMLLERVLKTKQVDVLSLNENEALSYACLLDSELAQKRRGPMSPELVMTAGRILAQNLSARIDLHTSSFAATLRGNREVVVPTFKIEMLRATGAGDAWNAGNIYGDHHGLPDECRLTLANAVSACYLTDPVGMHPNKPKLQAFLANQP
jgi:sugar/nucleoside kinase (ribokinase family)